MSNLVLRENDDRVCIVTLNRPDKLNAINKDLRLALTNALRLADADADTSVVLLRATGRSFCVGYDIGGGNDIEAWRHDALKWHEYLRECLAFEMLPWEMKKPVVAAVQGHALGGGCELAMLCDLTIASEDALFGEPEIRFSNAGPAIVLPLLVGYKKARELLYFGDSIDAKTALELGLINRIVPSSELSSAALKYAKRLALISPEALYWTKLAVSRGADAAGFRNALNAGVDIVSPLYAAKTELGLQFQNIKAHEGLGAALSWRAAQFKQD
jgi:enoyl-CoA hydratase/carnithine racemase